MKVTKSPERERRREAGKQLARREYPDADRIVATFTGLDELIVEVWTNRVAKLFRVVNEVLGA